MTSRSVFQFLYRLGFTPWDEHRLASTFQDLIEGDDALVPGKALDVGCGTGDGSIYLAKHGWQVTGVDFVAAAVEKARAKAAANKVAVTFAQADVTRLSSEGVGTNFDLIVDSGCLHGMSDEDRDAYAREVAAVAAPNARLSIIAASRGLSFPVRGVSQSDIEPRFTQGWELLSTATEPTMSFGGRFKAIGDRLTARRYLLARRS